MLEERSFTTPRGSVARLRVRPGTNDGMMSESAISGDEYRLRDVELRPGDTAVDVGAHIGMVSIALALDNPGARILAVEPVPENLELLRENVELNGLSDRVRVLEGGAATPTARTISVAYGFEGGELESMHRFVGNQPMPKDTPQRIVKVEAFGLPDIVRAAHGYVRLLVIDAEGAEYQLLRGKSLEVVEEIRGEYHDGFDRLASQLAATHDVERVSGDDSFGSFVAKVRR